MYGKLIAAYDPKYEPACGISTMRHPCPCMQGDQLLATSGYIYERKIKYQETWVPSGEKAVRLTTRSEVTTLPSPPP